jgi:hypothetical protein
MLHPENNQGNRNENSSNRLALVHDGKIWWRFHFAATTLSSLQEFARCVSPHRAPHPRALREGEIVVSPAQPRRNPAAVFRNSGHRCPRTGPCPAFGTIHKLDRGIAHAISTEFSTG